MSDTRLQWQLSAEKNYRPAELPTQFQWFSPIPSGTILSKQHTDNIYLTFSLLHLDWQFTSNSGSLRHTSWDQHNSHKSREKERENGQLLSGLQPSLIPWPHSYPGIRRLNLSGKQRQTQADQASLRVPTASWWTNAITLTHYCQFCLMGTSSLCLIRTGNHVITTFS